MSNTNNFSSTSGDMNERRIVALRPDQNHIITSVRGRRSTGFLLTRRDANGKLTTQYHLQDKDGNVRNGQVEDYRNSRATSRDQSSPQ